MQPVYYSRLLRSSYEGSEPDIEHPGQASMMDYVKNGTSVHEATVAIMLRRTMPAMILPRQSSPAERRR